MADLRANKRVRWSRKRASECTILDVDWHCDRSLAPTVEALADHVRLTRPVPRLWWVSASGHGLHLLYAGVEDEPPAECLAAAAGLYYLQRTNCTAVELLVSSRAPNAHPLHDMVPTYDFGPLPSWIAGGGADESAIEQWCAERGTSIGQRLAHTECPMDPRPNDSAGTPVQILPSGAYCHVCKRLTTWPELTGSSHGSLVADAAKHLVDFGNAKLAVSELLGRRACPYYPRALYRACLEAAHPRSPLVGLAMVPAPYLWGEGRWLNPKTLHPAESKNQKSSFGRRAACKFVDPDGNVTIDHDRIAEHTAPGLTPAGYPVHIPMRGASIAWHHNDPLDRALRVPIIHRDTVPTRYLPADTRMSLDAVQAVLDARCPGVSMDYLQLLLAARGHAEWGGGSLPMILLTGPSGAAKSATPYLAAALLGDDVGLVHFTGKARRVDPHEAIGEQAIKRPGWLLLDEWAKSLSGQDQADAFTPLLLTTSELQFRKNVVGPTSVKIASAVVVTNTNWAPEVLRDEQIGRRMVRVHLPSRAPVSWRRTVGEVAHWRRADTSTPDMIRAADSLISHVIDRWYSGTPPSFTDIARQLGYDLQERYATGEGDDTAGLVRELWQATMEHPEWVDGGRWRGPDWRVIEDWSSRLGEAWDALADRPRAASSRALDGADLESTLGLRCPAIVKAVPYGKRLGLRWQRADRHPNARDFLTGYDLLAEPDPAVDRPARVEVRSPAADRTVYFDFETRSRYEIKTGCGERYAQHESTDILCCVFVEIVGRWHKVHVWVPDHVELDLDTVWPTDDIPWARDNAVVELGIPDVSDATVIAHNSEGFDRHIWERFDWPKPAAWGDSIPMARASALPGQLDLIGKRLFGIGKSRDQAKAMRLTRPDKRTGEFLPYNSTTALPLVRYCVQDTLLLAHACEDERLAEHWPVSERQTWAANCAVNSRGFGIDVPLARRIIDAAETMIQRDAETATSAAGLEIGDLRRTEFLRGWLAERGCELPNMQATTIRDWLAGYDASDETVDVEVDPTIFGILRARLEIVKTITNKLINAVRRADQYADHRLRYSLVYHAAHTGRASSRGFQAHNMAKGAKFPRGYSPIDHIDEILRYELPDGVDPIEALTSLIRAIIVPTPGKVLAISDFSRIEPCALAWAAGQDDLREQLEHGHDPYRALGAQIFACTSEQVTDAQRALCKALILGCGYRMGPAAFARRVALDGVDLAAVGMTPRSAVDAYRKHYEAIAGTYVRDWETPQGVIVSVYQGGFWRQVESDAMESARKGEQVGSYGMADGHLIDVLPSGREMVYRDASIEPVTPPWGGEPRDRVCYDHPSGGRRSLHGGIQTENHIQAIGYDLMGAALVRVEAHPLLEPVLHVHDELIAEVDEAGGGRAGIQALNETMTIRPAWATDIPIHVEGFVSPRYTKAPPEGAEIFER